MKIITVSWLVVVAAIVVGCSSSSDGPPAGGGGSGGSAGSAGSVAMGQGGEGGAACIHCFDAVLLLKPRTDVCADAADIYQNFADCICRGKCMTPCGETCANPNTPPSIDCQTCIFKPGDQGCGDEYATCSADK